MENLDMEKNDGLECAAEHFLLKHGLSKKHTSYVTIHFCLVYYYTHPGSRIKDIYASYEAESGCKYYRFLNHLYRGVEGMVDEFGYPISPKELFRLFVNETSL